MKNIQQYIILLLMSAFMLASCSPQDGDDYSLGTPDKVDANDVSFTYAPTAEKENVIVFTNKSTPKVPTSVLWDLGNGVTSKAQTVKGEYPMKGEYTVKLTVYSADGTAVTKTETITIQEDDFSLLNTKMYNAITGGFENSEGKTWVFDRTRGGHFGVGPADQTSPEWWSAEAENKAESSLYDQEFTFILDGLKLIWKNKGKIYTNEAGKNDLATQGYTSASVPPAGDWDVVFTPQDSYSFSINESDNQLILSKGAFMGHYVGTSEYTIQVLNNEVLYIKAKSTLEGNAWWYRFIPKTEP